MLGFQGSVEIVHHHFRQLLDEFAVLFFSSGVETLRHVEVQVTVFCVPENDGVLIIVFGEESVKGGYEIRELFGTDTNIFSDDNGPRFTMGGMGG